MLVNAQVKKMEKVAFSILTVFAMLPTAQLAIPVNAVSNDLRNFDITYKEKDGSAKVVSEGSMEYGQYTAAGWKNSGIVYDITSYDNNTIEVHAYSTGDVLIDLENDESGYVVLPSIVLADKAYLDSDGNIKYSNPVNDPNYIMNSNVYTLNENGQKFIMQQGHYGNDDDNSGAFFNYIYVLKDDIKKNNGNVDIDFIIEAPSNLDTVIPLCFANKITFTLNNNVNLGDIDSDGNANASDASMMLVYSACKGVGKEVEPEVEEAMQKNGDVNGDNSVNASDASLTLMYSAYRGAGQGKLSLADFMVNKL